MNCKYSETHVCVFLECKLIFVKTLILKLLPQNWTEVKKEQKEQTKQKRKCKLTCAG